MAGFITAAFLLLLVPIGMGSKYDREFSGVILVICLFGVLSAVVGIYGINQNVERGKGVRRLLMISLGTALAGTHVAILCRFGLGLG